MGLIFLCFTALLLLVNLAGVALLLRPWLPYYPVAKVAGALGFCLLLFFVEHFIGLGRLTWLWPLSSMLSLAVIYRWRAELKTGLWRQEAVFMLMFASALFWKFSFPNIDAHAEQLTDLAFITSYMSGVTLPPPDFWLPDQRLDFYYSFQQYDAALLGRILGLTTGYAMNMATMVLLSMQASLAWFVTGRIEAPRWPRVLLVYAIMLGGTGIAPFTHFILDQSKPGSDPAFIATTNIWANVRFAGMFDAELSKNKLTHTLFPQPSAASLPSPDFQARDLPLETISYSTFQGEYHASQGGFLILFLALACLSLLEGPRLETACDGAPEDHAAARALQALLAASVPLTFITNTWVFPLQAAMLLSWVIYRYARRAPPDWPALLLGGFGALALTYPFISYFAQQALVAPIRWVTSVDHTPLNRFIAIHWPVLLLLGLGALRMRRQRYALLLVTLLAALLLGSELFYVDDTLGDKYNRFNSALKWWSWIYYAILLGIGPILLGAGRVWRWMTVAVLLLVSSASIDMAAYWYYGDKSAMGKISGHYWLTQDQVDKQLLSWLTAAPNGVVLEGLGVESAYTPTSALALFAGKPAAMGWPDHEGQWRGNPTFIYSNAEQARAFYHGTLTNALGWLDLNDVRYIVWVRRDEARDPAARPRIQAQIGSAYDWKPFWKNGDDELGVWVRRD